MTVSIRSFAKRPFGAIFIVSAPSGAGKTTLSNELLEVLPDIALSVSYTTRWLPGPDGYKLQLYGCSAEEAGHPRKFLIPRYR